MKDAEKNSKKISREINKEIPGGLSTKIQIASLKEFLTETQNKFLKKSRDNLLKSSFVNICRNAGAYPGGIPK